VNNPGIIVYYARIRQERVDDRLDRQIKRQAVNKVAPCGRPVPPKKKA